MSEPFQLSPGGVTLELDTWQVELLTQVVELVESGDDELPVSAYADDPNEDEQYRRLLASERDSARTADQSAVSLSLELAADGVVLSRAEAEAWLRVLGEGRLILGGRLGIKDASWEADDEEGAMGVLHYLGWLQASLIDVLSDELGDDPA